MAFLIIGLSSGKGIAQTQSGNRVVVIPLWSEGSTWKGAWADATFYKRSDIVEYDGSSYIAISSHNSTLANFPPNDQWELVAASGATGGVGVKGDKGAEGPKGDKGLKGDTGLQGATGVAGPIGLPGSQGPVGETGPEGPAGPIGASAYIATAPIVISEGATAAAPDVITFNVASMPSIPSSKLPSFQVNTVQPSTVVMCTIALQGVFPSRSAVDPLLGELMWGGWNFAPRGFAKCDGQLLAISSNSALFSLLGTMYGGDGRTTFGLPDMRGRVPMHPGNGPGLTPRRQGDRIGSELGSPQY